MYREDERKLELEADKEEPDDISDSEDEPERFDPSERFMTTWDEN